MNKSLETETMEGRGTNISSDILQNFAIDLYWFTAI